MKSHDNVMVILSSPSGAGKLLYPKFSKNINRLKFLYHIQQENLEKMKLMVSIITLFQRTNSKNL